MPNNAKASIVSFYTALAADFVNQDAAAITAKADPALKISTPDGASGNFQKWKATIAQELSDYDFIDANFLVKKIQETGVPGTYDVYLRKSFVSVFNNSRRYDTKRFCKETVRVDGASVVILAIDHIEVDLKVDNYPKPEVWEAGQAMMQGCSNGFP